MEKGIEQRIEPCFTHAWLAVVFLVPAKIMSFGRQCYLQIRNAEQLDVELRRLGGWVDFSEKQFFNTKYHYNVDIDPDYVFLKMEDQPIPHNILKLAQQFPSINEMRLQTKIGR